MAYFNANATEMVTGSITVSSSYRMPAELADRLLSSQQQLEQQSATKCKRRATKTTAATHHNNHKRHCFRWPMTSSAASKSRSATVTTTTTTTTRPITKKTATHRASIAPIRSIVFIATTCLIAATLTLLSHTQTALAASNRINMHQVSRQTNQYFLNEFCDLESKTLRSAKKLKQASDTNSLFLTSKNTLSSVRVLPQKQQMPSSISFGFGSSQQAYQAPIFKQLNCSIIVVAPKSHGLLVTVNSIGLPKNLTKLGITLNHDSPHAQHIHLEAETTSANYLLTQPQSSKIAINLQSFQPIDWSHVSFDILFTVYKKANTTGGCPNKKWFDCGDNICVPSSLVCDKNRNCPNGNDEMIFYRCYSPLFWAIAVSCGLALILVAIMIAVIMMVRRQRRRRGLTKLNSFSHNQLAADNDLMVHENSSSKLDLTQAEQRGQVAAQNYLASNMYLGGFENPVWTNGTLTKQQANQGLAGAAIVVGQQQQQQQQQSQDR